jgi:SAM-dependent methyltransferase
MNFDKKAGLYHQNARIQKIVADWCAEWIEEDCRGLSALELGAGTGLFTRHLALRAFANLQATDVSKSMVAEGQSRLPNVVWKLLDAWECEDPIEVDRIYACSLLQWSKKPSDTLKRWRSLLRPNGRFLGCLFVAGSLKEMNSGDFLLGGFAWRSVRQWRAYFQEAGFRIERYDARIDQESYDSPVQAFRQLHDMGATMDVNTSPGRLRQHLKGLETKTGRFGVTWKTLRLECSVD